MRVLDLRDLNRATLARQHLLERADAPVAQVVRDVGGLQAQLPAPPLIGLWSRIAGFERRQLLDAVRAGEVVRGTSLRGTLHLHEVDDYRALRMTLQPMLDGLARGMSRRIHEDDAEPAVEFGRSMFAAGPVGVKELKAALAERFPRSDPQALGNVVRCRLQLLLVPDDSAPDGWKANSAPFVDARSIVGDTFEPPDPRRAVRRFLEVLGPGSVRDAQTWTSMRGLRAVIERMHAAGELVTVTTWDGGELYDLPDAPRPSGDTPAGVRFLPMWDDVLLSHADRSRIVDPAWRPYLASRNGMSPPTFLVDGFVHGTWSVERNGSDVRLQLAPFTAIPAAAQDALVREGEALLAFLEPGAERREVRLG